MNRVAEIIEQATVLEDLPGTGRIVRASQIRVIRSEAMRHSEELVCLILAEGISLRDGMALTFKAEDLAEQCANMGAFRGSVHATPPHPERPERERPVRAGHKVAHHDKHSF